MTIDPNDHHLDAEVPVADAVEQQQPAILDDEDAQLNPEYVANRLEIDANTVDVIDQAIAVPLPDDERDGDID
jgi:hypothetical protein